MPDIVILYVTNPTVSAAFYERLLGQAPAEASPGFVMIRLSCGLKLDLWGRGGVQPGGGEWVFLDADPDARHAEWAARGIAIAEPPATQEFGRSFVALDPDGHRLRVLAP